MRRPNPRIEAWLLVALGTAGVMQAQGNPIPAPVEKRGLMVEIRDIVIPQDLEDAMSRQAQAERERQARVILGESEKQIAASFAEAAQAYVNNPTALHLRAMNMLFEGLKEKGALVIVPSSAVDTMNLGAVSGIVSIAQNNIPREEK